MPVYEFNEEKHIHTLDGKELFGTTTVLGIIDKPQLVQWAADVASANAFECESKYPGILKEYETAQALSGPAKTDAKAALDKKYPEYKKARVAHRGKKEKAADWGTIVHKALEHWIKVKVVPMAVDVKGKAYPILPEHHVAIDNFINWATENNVRFLFSEKGIYSEEWQVGGIVDFVCEMKGKVYVGDIKTSSDIYESYWLQTAAYAKMLVELNLSKPTGMVIVNCKKDGTVNVKERFHISENIKCFEAALTLYKRFKEDN